MIRGLFCMRNSVKRWQASDILDVPTLSMFAGDEIIINTISGTAFKNNQGIVEPLNFAEYFPVSYSFTSPSSAPNSTQGQKINYRASTDLTDGLFYILDDDSTGVTINEKTGTMSGGESAPVGVYTIILQSSNSIGTTKRFNLNWEVTL